MIDPKIIRENPEKVKAVVASGRGNVEKANINRWLELDAQRSELKQKVEKYNQKKNEISKVGSINPEEARRLAGELKSEFDISKLNADLETVEKEWNEIASWIPNMPIEEFMTLGKGEEDNIVIKVWTPDKGYIEIEPYKYSEGSAKYMPQGIIHSDKPDMQPIHHLDIGEALGIINNQQAALIAGTRFTFILEDLALLQYALQQFMFEKLIADGFKYVIPPLLVKEKVLFGTSHLPEHADQFYRIEKEYLEEGSTLALVGSSEPSNFALFMDRTVDEKDLPYKMFAYTPCFRSEVGSWGKDVRGIKRVHQFDKIEMDVVCKPEESNKIFDELLAINEWILQSLKLPYHLVQKCTGDAGYMASARQVDPEAWLGSQQTFMEVGTDTNTTDFQARRMNIKVKRKDGTLELAHTVNDTAIAMGRMLIAIIENYQQSDGTIKIPEVLRKYFGNREFIGK